MDNHIFWGELICYGFIVNVGDAKTRRVGEEKRGVFVVSLLEPLQSIRVWLQVFCYVYH